MDLSKDIYYRGLNLNGAFSQDGTRVLSGLTVENVDYSTVQAVGYSEKRAASDGMHASDVYAGARQMTLQGLIYATTIPELFDWLHLVRATFSATSAYGESPGDQGFLPFTYKQPTSDEDSFPTGVIDLQMLLRPLDGSPQFSINRDRTVGRNGERPSALPYLTRLWAKDPRVYVNPLQIVDVSGAHASLTSGVAINRGDYETPLNILLVVGSTAPTAPNNVFTLKGFGVDMTITLEATKANRVYRWYGSERVLMSQDTSGGPNAPFVLRMDLVKFNGQVTKPMVPAQINPPTKPFSSSFQYSCPYALASGSRLFWGEAFA